MKKSIFLFAIALILLTLTLGSDAGAQTTTQPVNRLNWRVIKKGHKWSIDVFTPQQAAILRTTPDFRQALAHMSNSGHHAVTVHNKRGRCLPEENLKIVYYFFEKEKLTFFYVSCNGKGVRGYYVSLRYFSKGNRMVPNWIDGRLYKYGLFPLIFAHSVPIQLNGSTGKKNQRLESFLSWYYPRFLFAMFGAHYKLLATLAKSNKPKDKMSINFFCHKTNVPQLFIDKMEKHFETAILRFALVAEKPFPIKIGEGFVSAYLNYLIMVSVFVNAQIVKGILNLEPPPVSDCSMMTDEKLSLNKAAIKSAGRIYLPILNKLGFKSKFQEDAKPVDPSKPQDGGDKPEKPSDPPKPQDSKNQSKFWTWFTWFTYIYFVLVCLAAFIIEAMDYMPSKSYVRTIANLTILHYVFCLLCMAISVFYVLKILAISWNLILLMVWIFSYGAANFISSSLYTKGFYKGSDHIIIDYIESHPKVFGILMVNGPKPEEIKNPLFEKRQSLLHNIDLRVDLWSQCLSAEQLGEIEAARQLTEKSADEDLEASSESLHAIHKRLIAHESKLVAEAARQRKAEEYRRNMQAKQQPVSIPGSGSYRSEQLEEMIIEAMRGLSKASLIEQFNDQLFDARDLDEPAKNQALWRLWKEVKEHQ